MHGCTVNILVPLGEKKQEENLSVTDHITVVQNGITLIASKHSAVQNKQVKCAKESS